MVAEKRAVRVIHGANDGVFDVAGYPLARLRSSLASAFNIPPEAIAFVNGRRVPQSYEPVADDVIEFIREQGVKGGRKMVVAEPKVLPDLEFRDEPPDMTTMSLKGLANSSEYERMAILVAHKSAVDLFWAGSALSEVKSRCLQESHGKWKAWKKDNGLADTTVNDAIRLFNNAKTPDALTEMGITEAKKRFVYPSKDETEQKSKPLKSKATKRKPTSQPDQQQPVNEKPNKVDAEGPTEEQPEDEGDDFTVIDPAETVAEALEDIAQQLNEITQDDLGRVDLTQEVPARLTKAAWAVFDSITKLCRRIDHDRKDS